MNALSSWAKRVRGSRKPALSAVEGDLPFCAFNSCFNFGDTTRPLIAKDTLPAISGILD